MMKDDRLQQYLDDELNEDERLQLEQEMATSPDLMEEFARLMEIRTAIQASGDRELRAEVKSYMEDYKAANATDHDEIEHELSDASGFMGHQRKWVIITGIAASILLLMMFNPWKETQQAPLTPQVEQAPVTADSAAYKEEKSMIDTTTNQTNE